jgi:hypothetical protein
VERALAALGGRFLAAFPFAGDALYLPRLGAILLLRAGGRRDRQQGGEEEGEVDRSRSHARLTRIRRAEREVIVRERVDDRLTSRTEDRRRAGPTRCRVTSCGR